MNETEYKQFVETQKGLPVITKVFKHKYEQDRYETQINIFELCDYDEVKY